MGSVPFSTETGLYILFRKQFQFLLLLPIHVSMVE